MNVPSWHDIQRSVDAAPSLDTFTADYAPGRNSIQVSTPEELRAVLTTAIMHTCSYDDSRRGERFIHNTVLHEQRHDEAARAVGAKVLGYGIHFFDGGSKLFAFHQAESVGVPLLDAAIELHPEVPSHHDKTRAAALGYESVEKLAHAVERYNGQHGTAVPIPLSYKPKGRTHIPLANPKRLRR